MPSSFSAIIENAEQQLKSAYRFAEARFQEPGAGNATRRICHFEMNLICEQLDAWQQARDYLRSLLAQAPHLNLPVLPAQTPASNSPWTHGVVYGGEDGHRWLYAGTWDECHAFVADRLRDLTPAARSRLGAYRLLPFAALSKRARIKSVRARLKEERRHDRPF